MDPLELEFNVACDTARAFSLWAEQTTRWWPPGHSVSAAPGLTVTFEPRPGGRIYERTPAGAEHDWGEVLAWEPPHRLVYLWHLASTAPTPPRSRSPSRRSTMARACGSSIAAGSASAAPPRNGADRNRRGWAGVTEHYRRVAMSFGDSAD